MIAYDDKCQGRGPLEILVAAIWRHGIACGEKMQREKSQERIDNLENMLTIVNKIKDEYII